MGGAQEPSGLATALPAALSGRGYITQLTFRRLHLPGRRRSGLVSAGLDAATEEEDRDRRADLLRLGKITGHDRAGGSSWHSLQRGTGDIETDYL